MFPLVFLFNIYTFFICVYLLFWYYCTCTFNYWKECKIRFKKPVPFFGNIARFALFQEPFYLTLNKLYKYFQNDDFGSIFQMREPILLVKNPDLVYQILVKDFQNFCNRGAEIFGNPSEILQRISKVFRSTITFILCKGRSMESDKEKDQSNIHKQQIATYAQ